MNNDNQGSLHEEGLRLDGVNSFQVSTKSKGIPGKGKCTEKASGENE